MAKGYWSDPWVASQHMKNRNKSKAQAIIALFIDADLPRGMVFVCTIDLMVEE
jgi:hypothetical protein